MEENQDQTNLEDLVSAYLKAPKPKIQKSWTNSEEAALRKLKAIDCPLKETALGVATTQMARAVGNNLGILSTPERQSLSPSLADYEEGEGPNCL